MPPGIYNLLLLLNAHHDAIEFRPPTTVSGEGELVVDTSEEEPGGPVVRLQAGDD